MQRFGLLATPAAPIDTDRRIEDWIASQLDLRIEKDTDATPRNIWNRIIERLPAMRRTHGRRQIRGGSETAFSDWSRFRIAYRKGITVVRLVDRALVKESPIRELARDLIELIEAGNLRILLNFQGVDRAASWVALAVDEAYRRCKAAVGGELKICGLSAALADVTKIAGVAPGIELHADETTALEAHWPEPGAPRTLPVDILLALTAGSDPPPIRGGGPSDSSEAVLSANDKRTPSRTRRAKAQLVHGDPGIWLIVQMGASKGRPVSVSGSPFVIGRQHDCQMRLRSPMVSKLHAAIERRDGRIFVRDLGSTNGTVVNGRPLRSKEAEIHDGDRIQIGPVVCTMATVAQREGSGKVEEHVAEWLYADSAGAQFDQVNALETAVIATSGPETEGDSELSIKTEVIQDVLVVTPEVGDLESESTIELLRSHLHSLLSQPVPRRVVVNLEYVAHLTGQAIGVLLAHHLRLDRSGGSLRICQARSRIMAVLHQVRLTMLVECHPTLDEAVLSAWPAPPRRAPAGN
jgi:anti-anti-sigma factor